MCELTQNSSIINTKPKKMMSDREKMIFARRLGLPVFWPSKKYMQKMFRKFRLYLILHSINSIITPFKEWVLLENNGKTFYGCAICPFGKGGGCKLKGQERITSNKHGDVEFERPAWRNSYRRCIEWVRYV